MTRYVATWNGLDVQNQIPEKHQKHPEEFIKKLNSCGVSPYYLGCVIPVKYQRNHALGLVRVPVDTDQELINSL